MLTTIIYRSHICDDVPVTVLEEMVNAANNKNGQADVTGILLFNGRHFFQLLEGPEENVKAIYRAITIWWSCCATTRRRAALVNRAWNSLIYAIMSATKCSSMC